MMGKVVGPPGKCYGSVTVGSHGQVVIPADARRELGIDLGDKLLVFQSFHGNGLIMIKAEAVERFLRIASERLGELESLIKEPRQAGPK